jgi:hypothetical protein
MILGDSFAEALQVNMESKVGALLETKLRKKLGRPVDILTLGCSGTGQANQYAYWRKYREAFKPHLLVLLMVENDIRDNDPELSARYHRWNPLYPPRTYFFASPKGPDGLGEVPISEIWQQHAALLESPTVVESDFLSSVSRWSKLGRFVLARTAPAKGTPWNQTYRGHQVDMAFLTPELKNDPLLKESWNLSEKVVAKYARELAGIGTRLAFMVGSVHPTSTANSGKYQVGTFYDWVANQAKANGAGYISLPDKLDALQKQSKDVCVSDGHWNEEGHALAADCLAEYILKAVPR